jgi:hypothetical protein
MFGVYTGMLRMMDCFRNDQIDVSIKYLIGEGCGELCEKYGLFEVAGSKDDFDKAINLLEWISSNIFHYGNYRNHVENTAMKLFEYSFGKGVENGINCRSLSLALAECLLAVGINARTIYIMPFSPYDFDNHVVCEAWIERLGKWVMLDPSYNLYVFHEGIYLSVLEFRELLANQTAVMINERANYNNDPINKEELVSYYAKDLFRFMVSDTQGSNSEDIDGRKMINITPIGYDVKNFTLANIDYRIMKSGENENLLKWRKEAEEEKIIYKGIDILY